MRSTTRKRTGRRLALGSGLLALIVGILPTMSAPAVAQIASGSSGVVCTTSPTATFSLTAQSGYIGMPDGNVILAWSYGVTGGAFQFPGPVLCVTQGDSVTIVLNNSLAEPVSMDFLGIDTVLANGALAQPQFDTSGTLTSLSQAAPPSASVTYTFTATTPGSYLYESGTDPGKQVQMGLYGALVVYPSGRASRLSQGYDCAYDCTTNAASRFNPKTEFVMLFSEIDPALHQAIERGQTYDVTAIHPRYWLINGRSFPDTIAPNNAAWLAPQPYSALVHMNVADTNPADVGKPAYNPYPALIRYLDAGALNHPFHPHGQNGRMIARDAQPLVSPTNQDLSFETFAFSIGSGQTWDGTYQFFNQENYDPVSNPIPVTIPQLQNLTVKGNATYYSGSPYLGVQGQLPTGTTSYNQCGEYYMVFHSHALNEVANFDAGFGGMLTLQRIDPPQGPANTCKW
jgi:FtsP/CotA-like multicopper oxidase with cupredoxin domain